MVALLTTVGTIIRIAFIAEFLLRSLRPVRIVGAANRSMNALRATLRRRQFGYVLGITALVIGLGAAGMFSFEPASEVEGGFSSFGDALWWTAMLVSSVGSDFWPRTTEGRAPTALLTLYGLAVFGYVTASLASFFIDRDAQRDDAEIAGAGELRALRAELAALRRELAERPTR
jgi:voltage-gated potassium channel